MDDNDDYDDDGDYNNPVLGLLLADSALAVGRGKTFRRVSQVFFTRTAITREWKVENSFPGWEMNRLSKGYKWVVDQN